MASDRTEPISMAQEKKNICKISFSACKSKNHFENYPEQANERSNKIHCLSFRFCADPSASAKGKRQQKKKQQHQQQQQHKNQKFVL